MRFRIWICLIFVMFLIVINVGFVSAVDRNLALDAGVVADASSNYGANTPDKAIDDNYASYWQAGAKPANFSVNLNSIKLISHLKIHGFSGCYHMPTNYTIKYSNDEISWTTLADIMYSYDHHIYTAQNPGLYPIIITPSDAATITVKEPVTGGGECYAEIVFSSSIVAQFIKIDIFESDSTGIILSEFQVWGDDLPVCSQVCSDWCSNEGKVCGDYTQSQYAPNRPDCSSETCTCQPGCSEPTPLCTALGQCVECEDDGDCTADYYDAPYCDVDDNVYRTLHDFSCVANSCIDTTTEELVATCQFGCIDGACDNCPPRTSCDVNECGTEAPDNCGGNISCDPCPGNLICDNLLWGTCVQCVDVADCPSDGKIYSCTANTCLAAEQCYIDDVGVYSYWDGNSLDCDFPFSSDPCIGECETSGGIDCCESGYECLAGGCAEIEWCVLTFGEDFFGDVLCSSYTEHGETECADDQCGAKYNEGYDAVTMKGTTGCYWEDYGNGDSGDDICLYNETLKDQPFSCIKTSSAGECIGGERAVSWTVRSDPLATQEAMEEADCVAGSGSFPCGQTELSFFSFIQFICVLSLVLLFYLIRENYFVRGKSLVNKK